MALMSSISGFRGLVGEDINALSVLNYTEAFVNSLTVENKRICIGRDTRKSGIFIKDAVISTIIALGYEAVDIGIAPTPTTLHATRKLNSDGGIIITASHNPPMWNALKLSNPDGLFLDEKSINLIVERSKNILREINWATYDAIGNIQEKYDYYKNYIDDILTNFNIEAIRKMGFKIAYDPVGGAATIADRYFFERLGCKTIPVNAEITGDFPRNPEPTPQNLKLLSEVVKNSHANLGFAQDPDADRLSVITGNGVPVGEEFTIVLAGEGFLRKKKTDIACNLSTSLLIEDLARKFSVSVHRTKIGEAFVTEKILKEGLEYGGEGNGGVIIPSINPCRDSFVGMAQILELLAETGKTIEEIVNTYPAYKMIKDKIDLKGKVNDKDHFYDKILRKIKYDLPNFEINTIDGVKIIGDKQWLHLRLSNTEPQIRIVAESLSEKHSRSLIDIGKKVLSDIIDLR